MEDFAARMREQQYAADTSAKVDRFEQRVVEAILKKVNYATPTATLRREYKRTSGKDVLDFAWFTDFFGAFPAQLYADKLSHTYNISWANLFGDIFFKQPWVVKYMDIVGSEAIDLRKDWFALVFVVPHASKANLMVVHNRFVGQEFASEGSESCTKIVRRLDRLDTSLVIEPLTSFIEATGKHWHHSME